MTFCIREIYHTIAILAVIHRQFVVWCDIRTHYALTVMDHLRVIKFTVSIPGLRKCKTFEFLGKVAACIDKKLNGKNAIPGTCVIAVIRCLNPEYDPAGDFN